MTPIRTAAARELSVFALFALLTIVMTWPLASHLATAVPDPGDAYFSSYVMAWDYHATFSSAHLFSLPIFHPAKDALAFSENFYGVALPLFPLYALGLSPLTVYNIGILLAFALSGYAAFVLARVIGATTAAAIAAGCVFAFLPYRFTHLAQIQLLTAVWLTLTLASALAYTQSPTWKRAALFGAAFFLNGLACLHWFAIGAMTVAFSVPVAIAVIPAARRIRFWIRPVATSALATLALLPLFLPYRKVRVLYHMERTLADLEQYSAHAGDWLVGALHLRYGAYVNNGSIDPERWLFPGLVPLLIALTLLWQRPQRYAARFAIAFPLLALTYFRIVHTLPLRWDFPSFTLDLSGSPWVTGLIALALLLPFPDAETDTPPRRMTGVPFALLWLAAGFVCSLGVHSALYRALFALVSPFRGIRAPVRWAMIAYVALAMLVAVALSRRHTVVALLCTLAIFAEQYAPNRYYYTVAETPAVYRWLKTAPIEGAIFELPFRRDGSEYRYMLRGATHFHPMVNGLSSFEPKDLDELESLDASLLPKLRARGVSHIIVHTDRIDASAWLAENATALHLVRRFCNDAVYAIDRSATPLETCDVPSAHLETPPPNADIRGPLLIEGTIDRPGVRVRALFEGGRLSVPLAIEGNRFILRLPSRAANLHALTDLQIEITDRGGKRTLLDDEFLQWRKATDLLFYDWRSGALHELAARMHRPDAFAYQVRDSTRQVNVIARALLRDTRGMTDEAFVAEAERALLGRGGESAGRLRAGSYTHFSRYDYIVGVIGSDEFAAKHLLPTPR